MTICSGELRRMPIRIWKQIPQHVEDLLFASCVYPEIETPRARPSRAMDTSSRQEGRAGLRVVEQLGISSMIRYTSGRGR